MAAVTTAVGLGLGIGLPLLFELTGRATQGAEERRQERLGSLDRLNRARATLAERRQLQARERSTRLALAVENVSQGVQENALDRLLTARDRAQLGTMGVRSAPTDAEVLAAFTQLRQLTGGF